MKLTKVILTAALGAGLTLGLLDATAADKGKKEPKPYPMDTCVVSGEKLGEHGKPYVLVHDGQEVKLCCKSCLKDFKKDSATYMKKIDEAAKKKKS